MGGRENAREERGIREGRMRKITLHIMRDKRHMQTIQGTAFYVILESLLTNKTSYNTSK